MENLRREINYDTIQLYYTMTERIDREDLGFSGIFLRP